LKKDWNHNHTVTCCLYGIVYGGDYRNIFDWLSCVCYLEWRFDIYLFTLCVSDGNIWTCPYAYVSCNQCNVCFFLCLNMLIVVSSFQFFWIIITLFVVIVLWKSNDILLWLQPFPICDYMNPSLWVTVSQPTNAFYKLLYLEPDSLIETFVIWWTNSIQLWWSQHPLIAIIFVNTFYCVFAFEILLFILFRFYINRKHLPCDPLEIWVYK